MDTNTLVRLVRAYCYAVAPYLCIFLALPGPRGPFAARLAVGLAAANAGFILVATLAAHVSLTMYQTAHPAIALVAVLCLLYRWRQAGWHVPPLKLEGPALVTTAIVLLAFAVRLMPMLLGGETLGGGDARFHNILARKVLLSGRLARDWLPFADIGVMYPQGVHTFAAFLAVAARCSAHEALNFMFPVAGALTTALIYLVAGLVFGSHRSAAWAAVCYAFLAVWGSLDLFRWGGLPNAMGMLILCLMLLAILGYARPGPGAEPVTAPTTERSRVPPEPGAEPVTAPTTERSRVPLRLVGTSLCLPAILLTHHYTLIVAVILLVSVAVFTADQKLRRFVASSAGLGLLLSAPLLAMHYFRFLGGIRSTGVLVFREPVRTAPFYLLHMGPGLVALFVCAILVARKSSWTSRQLCVLAWFAGLFAAFVFLEYFCRAGVLLATGGKDCFACLTPSRMVTNMVYPMSILCGAVPASKLWQKYRKSLVGGLAVLAVATGATVVRDQIGVGVFREFRAAAKWLAGQTPQNAMIVGSAPHLEYIAWRETSHPPLPASEQRDHPSLRRKREMTSFDAWLKWERDTGRSVYFIVPQGAARPAGLNELFTNRKVSILSTQEKREARPPQSPMMHFQGRHR